MRVQHSQSEQNLISFLIVFHRVVFAAIAFAMGLDSRNKVIHWKSPNDIEGYVQESGRGGRDGECIQLLC